MSLFIFNLTLKQLIRRRSSLLLLGLAAIPLLLALVFQLSDPEVNPERWTARVLYISLIVTVVLPLTALMLGTTVLGDEIEDGTIVYLVTKPLPRWQLLLPKVAAAWTVTTILLVMSTGLAGLIALNEGGGGSIIAGFCIAAAAGSLAYCSLFALLSVSTSRALIAGLIYVFLWEGAITGIFPGTRYLSVRHYSIALADWIADKPASVFEAYLGATAALVLMAMVIVAALLLANRRLEQVEVREAN